MSCGTVTLVAMLDMIEAAINGQTELTPSLVPLTLGLINNSEIGTAYFVDIKKSIPAAGKNRNRDNLRTAHAVEVSYVVYLQGGGQYAGRRGALELEAAITTAMMRRDLMWSAASGALEVSHTGTSRTVGAAREHLITTVSFTVIAAHAITYAAAT